MKTIQKIKDARLDAEASVVNALTSPSKKTRKDVFIVVGLLTMVLFAVPVFAADPTILTKLKDMMNSVSKWLMTISIPLAVLLVIINLIKYMTSSDPKVGQQARSNIFKIVAAFIIINIMPMLVSLIASLLQGTTQNKIDWNITTG